MWSCQYKSMSWITTWTESRNNMSWISLIEWNSWTTQVSAVRDAQQVARRKPLYSWYCPSWCLDAKNTLQSVHGFSPFQLAICQNASFPCAFTDKAPVLLTTQHNKIINGHSQSTRSIYNELKFRKDSSSTKA